MFQMDVVFDILYIFPATSERIFLCTHIVIFYSINRHCTKSKILYKIVF